MRLPKLYKLTSTGKIQVWEISTEGNKIVVIQGQLEGKKQRYEQTIKKGKNIGRANETTPEQQAEAEVKAKWEHKHNKDYHLSIEDCKQKKEIANEGGYLPMLAKDYNKHAIRHLKYPCYVQPKLDGLRCIATKKDMRTRLWFRSGKLITTMVHIQLELDLIMEEGDIFDGELYAHKEDFNTFTGAIRANKNLNPEVTEKIKYHIYDYPRINKLTEKDSFKERKVIYYGLNVNNKYLQTVDTVLVENFEQAMKLYKQFIEEGYEGIMFRNIDMPYEQKRSYNLLKYKEFIDDEFIIIGIEEGKGTLAGHVGSFICKIEDDRELTDIGGKTFVYTLDGDSRTVAQGKGTVKAKMEGTFAHLKYLYEHPKECMGKMLTIKYQNLSKVGVPRFPIGKAIRGE